MRIGLQLPNLTFPGGPPKLAGTLAEIARTADGTGFFSLWMMDHFFQIEPVGPADMEMLEGYSALGYFAGITSRVRLGTLVTGVTYRNPGILVKTVTTLDVLSGGRAYLGVGGAWFEREHQGLGVPFPPIGERFERLEETLRIAKQMWSNEVGAFEGKHYRLAETLNVPQPLARPHPPILIGGAGEKKNAPACRTVWRRVQPVRIPRYRRDKAQARCTEALLRRARTAVRGDREHNAGDRAYRSRREDPAGYHRQLPGSRSARRSTGNLHLAERARD